MTTSFPLESARILVDLAYLEDLNDSIDATSDLLIPSDSRGSAKIVARESGIVSGLEIIPLVIERFSADIQVTRNIDDGAKVSAGKDVIQMSGRTIDLLKTERTILNFLGRLSGIATLTNQFVQKTQGTNAKIYDTRKTTPGWRSLEKYAVESGGGVNHRMGLYDAVLIKDNHLAAIGYQAHGSNNWTTHLKRAISTIRNARPDLTIQIEVDTLDQLKKVLDLEPDIILLDNMDPSELSKAVEIRGKFPMELEASGGVNLTTVQSIAQSGVDRISIGALTHSATNFDWGLDWQSE